MKFYENCQVFTPIQIVDFLLNLAEYNTFLYGKKVLENSCGDGNILSKIVYNYIISSIDDGFSISDIKKGLENDIYAYEIDEVHYNNCLFRLNQLVQDFGITEVKWNIYNSDFLKDINNIKYDFIIGNPPYIAYSDLDAETRNFLKSSFYSCEDGKPDYYYAFLEKSLELLKENGKLVYLIPNNIFKNRYGKKIREIILPNLSKIIDYDDIKLFNNRLTTSSIVVCDRAYREEIINYINISKKTEETLWKKDLLDKWVFTNEVSNQGVRRFGDSYNVFISVATLLNKAFVLTNYQEDDDYLICDGIKLEKECIRDCASPRGLAYEKNEKIIFPYYYEDGKLKKLPKDIDKIYPGVYKYLNKFKKELDLRKKDESAKWFEYGRSQALAHLNQEKLLLSTIISNGVIINKLDSKVIPYSGIVITSKDGSDLNEAIEILTSKKFMHYAYLIGIKSNGTSVRISVNDIKNYRY